MVIEELLGFWVGSDEDLEATVEEEAINNICADAATNGIGCFEEEERDVLRVEVGGGG